MSIFDSYSIVPHLIANQNSLIILKFHQRKHQPLMHQIKQLYEITQQLREKYAKWNKQFTLDGRLVGDMGEVLAAAEKCQVFRTGNLTFSCES